MAAKVKLTDSEKLALITKAVEASMANNMSNFEFVINVSAIIHQEEVSLLDLGWGSEELAEIRAAVVIKECFSCKPGEGMPVKYHVPKYGYSLCEFHSSMALVAGWEIVPIEDPKE
jgi:hypothetical protein